MNKLTKKDIIIDILIFVIIVGVGLAVRYMPRTVPYSQCSEVYKRYCDVEGVRATYIKDFPLNDTLTIGVTLLEAETDSGWVRLQEDFAIEPLPPEVLAILDSNGVNMWKASMSDYSVSAEKDALEYYFIAMQYCRRRLSVFEIGSREQYEAIVNYQVRNTNSNSKKLKK